MLAFAVPYPAIYIGIAANDGRAPEGIASRMRKHWVKATGSHVSDRPGAGGVHHPTAWADFALDRFTHMRSAGEADTLADAVIMTGSIDGGANRKNVCLYYEGQLTRPGPLRAKLIHAIFGGAVQAPSLLNAARFARCHAEDDASVSFGTGETVRLED